MLIAEIAKLQIGPENAAIVEEVLADWEPFFPNSSALPDAAVWADLIQCRRRRQPEHFCKIHDHPAVFAFNSWHFNDYPVNPDGLPLPANLEAGEWNAEPSASWLLASATRTLTTTRSRWAANLMIRLALHTVGDMHQPLHATAGFFNNSALGILWPMSDLGGNRIRIGNPDAMTGSPSNLHAVWDAGGGLYAGTNWPLSAAEEDELRANASQIMTEYPMETFADTTTHRGKSIGVDEYDGCWDIFNRSCLSCSCVWDSWVVEMAAIVQQQVYVNVTQGGDLSATYIAAAQATSKRQIARGGYRLAEFLTRTLAHVHNWEALASTPAETLWRAQAQASAARAEADEARIQELEWQWALLLALTLIGWLALVTLGVVLLRRGKTAKRAPGLVSDANSVRALEYKGQPHAL